MCGISGFIHHSGLFLSNATSTVKDMVYLNRLRGVDALGFLKVKHGGEWDYYKDAGDPLSLLSYKSFKDFLDGIGDMRYFVQHNRHATKGEKKAASAAHPFEEKKGKDNVIIGVHNGTLTHMKDEKNW